MTVSSKAPTGTTAELQSSWRSYFQAFVLLASLLWCAVWFIHSWGYWEDDSFIHLEFARSLAAGRGFSFNGRLVYGDTAPLWVILLAGLHSLIPVWLTAGKVLAALGTVFTLSGVYVFSRRLIEPYPDNKMFAAYMVLLFVLNPYFCFWSFSGMETITAAGLTLWAVVLASLPLTWRNFLVGCALGGIAPILRPEMVFFTAILGLYLLYRRITVVGVSPSKKAAGLIAGVILLSGPTLAWAAYAVHTFGRVVPNTNAAKRAPIGASVTLRLINVYSLGFPVIVCGVVAGLLYLALHASRFKEKLRWVHSTPAYSAGGWIFFLWTLITCLFYIVNHTYVQTRYIFVSAAGLAIVTLGLLRSLSPRIYRSAVAACFIVAAGISIFTVWPFIRNKDIYVGQVRVQAEFIRDHLPANAPVADYNIGEVAFFSEHPILDTGGITRPDAIRYLEDPPGMLHWIHSQGAEYVQRNDQPEPGAVLVFSQQAPYINWSLNPRRYAGTFSFNLWKLAPQNANSAPPSSTPKQPLR